MEKVSQIAVIGGAVWVVLARRVQVAIGLWHEMDLARCLRTGRPVSEARGGLSGRMKSLAMTQAVGLVLVAWSLTCPTQVVRLVVVV